MGKSGEDLKLIKIEVGESMFFRLDQLPIRVTHIGTSFLDVQICIKRKYGKIQKIYMYPIYREFVEEGVYFEITPLKKDYVTLPYLRGLEVHHCKEHKCECFVGNFECTGKNRLDITVLNAMTSVSTYFTNKG